MSNNIDHDIINKDVIEREELIDYLTYLLENDGEEDKFFDRELLRDEEDDDIVPDVLGFRDWLREQDFHNIIRESYFKEYTQNHYEGIGEYNPDNFLHRYINWDEVVETLLDSDYERLFDDDDELHPFNIFRDDFVYHI